MQPVVDRNRPIVERFEGPGQHGYSDFWRCHKSPAETFELARLLSAMRKVVSYADPNAGQLVWSGMGAPNAIALDPAPIMGCYPVPADKVDGMIGLAIRRTLAKKEWSRRLRRQAMRAAKLPARYAYKFQLFLDMAERVYLDNLANRSVLGRYTSRQREQAIQAAFDQATHPPTISELLHIWWDMAADPEQEKYKRAYVDRSVRGGSRRTSLEVHYREPLALLNSVVEALIHACPGIAGVSERCGYRMGLYLSIWPPLFDQIKYWATDSKDPYLQNSRLAPGLKGLGDDLGKPSMPVQFARDVEKVLVKRTYDFTERVRETVDDTKEIVRIEENDLVMPGRDCIDPTLLQRLKMVLRAAAQKQTSANRGLRSGNIDRRRLYRAPTTGTIFEMTTVRFELQKTLIVLVDASGSMAAPHKWEQTEEIYQTLFSAILAFTDKARLFAYNEYKNVCRLTELYRKGEFFTVLPHGKTATGEALIAATHYIKASDRRALVIHLTDGASNWGCGVDEAIAHCWRKGIGLLTLGLSCDDDSRQMLRQEYGRLVRFVDGKDNLHQLMGDLLRKGRQVFRT